jgi:hypothetical protein|eukprot:COSAG01_NODE_23170_length_825_cov_2.931129_1_plen_82_part_00
MKDDHAHKHAMYFSKQPVGHEFTAGPGGWVGGPSKVAHSAHKPEADMAGKPAVWETFVCCDMVAFGVYAGAEERYWLLRQL